MPSVALPDGPELQRLLERAEIDQYADFFRALPQELAARMGLAFQQGPGWVRLTARGFDHPMFNRVLGLGLDAAEPDPREPLDTVLARSVEHYAAAGVRRWMLQVLPHVETASFRAAAANRGVVRLRGWAKHVGPARSDVPARTPLRVVRIGEPAAGGPPSAARLVEPWARIVVENFGLPDAFTPWLRRLLDRDRWHLYLALDGERPVATGALHISPSRVGPLGQLSFAATRPEDRGRGAQSALIARRAADAVELGAGWIVSETDEALPTGPNPSTRNLERLGFPVAYVRANWGPPKPASPTGDGAP